MGGLPITGWGEAARRPIASALATGLARGIWTLDNCASLLLAGDWPRVELDTIRPRV